MTNQDKAAQHAAKAEELLEESKKHKLQAPRAQTPAIQAGVHATLAVFYAGRPE